MAIVSIAQNLIKNFYEKHKNALDTKGVFCRLSKN